MAATVATLLLCACTASPPRLEQDTPGADVRPAPPASHETTVAAPTPTALDAAVARRQLTRPDVAAALAPGDLAAAVEVARDGELAGLVSAPWRDRVAQDLRSWPVVVGEASVTLDGVVELDVVLDVPADDDGTLVLRWLPAAPALGQAVAMLEVEVDGGPVEVTVDAPGARVLVPVTVGDRHVVRVRARYTAPDRGAIVDDGSPAGFGLLARTDDAVMLGHWLPLVALPSDDGPMQARGDVGAFPPAVHSLVVHHEGSLVTGGRERDCPAPADGCTWVQGVGLRDLSAVVLAQVASAGRGAATVHRLPDEVSATELDGVAKEAADGLAALSAPLGSLPWSDVDVVVAPLQPGAAGMEFPGLVWIDPGAWPAPGPEFGSYVLAHELAHQWFHALVGNGSLSAPVVDESLAQYLSVVVFDELFGQGAGDALAARSLGGRHEAAVGEGVPDEAPAQPLDAFASARSYGASVYGRGGQAWVEAERVAGRAAVLSALRALVRRHGLREVDAATVVGTIDELAPSAAGPLARGWGLDP